MVWPFFWTSLQHLFGVCFGCFDIAWSCTYSPFLNCPDYELLHMSDKAYMGGGVLFKTYTVEHHACGKSSTVTFAPVTMRKRAFCGPAATVLPGTTMEPNSAVMEFSLGYTPPDGDAQITRNTVVGGPIKTGTVMVGYNGKAVRYKPDHNKYPARSP